MNRYSVFATSAIVLFLFTFTSFAGNEIKNRSFSEKIFYGGSLGLTFGSITQVDIVPLAGLWVLPQWSVGVGGRYTYLSRRSLNSGERVLRTHIWGVSGFTQILPIADLSEVTSVNIHGGIILHGEYEGLYLDQQMVNPLSTLSGKTWINLYLAGIGYRQILGERAALNILFLWDLSNSQYSPYTSNPIIRFNVTF